MIYKNSDITKTKYYKYVQDVISGKQVACVYVRKACERFLVDIQREDMIFVPSKVQKVIDFCAKLRHFQGKSAGKYFILEPWQEFVTANIFGFYTYVENESTGKMELVRTRNLAYIEMSRKQGKTALIAAYGLYGLIHDNEMAAEIILAATTREQAAICYNLCVGFAKSIDPRGKHLKVLRTGIEYRKTMSILKVISADASKQDGFNAHFGVVDEFHAHNDSKLYDVIKSSQGFRKNPLMLVITTAGFNKELPCYQMRQTNIEILNGVKQDDGRFAIIYTLDDGDDWKDEKNWVKCSPNLGVTVTKQYIRNQVTSAVNNPTERVGVMTKTLNMWCDTSEVWISDDNVQKCMVEKGKKFKFDWKNYRDCNVWIGIDLAAVSDLTVVSFMVQDEEREKFVFKNYYFLPKDTIDKHPLGEYYRLMVREGNLIATNGNVTDYTYILNLILGIQRDYDIAIQSVAYDPWNSTQFTIEATENGLPMEKFSQAISNFNGPTRTMEMNILQEKVLIDCNPITMWCFRNVVLRVGSNENVKPEKISQKSNNKIDGVIAMIEALGVYMIQYGLTPEIFGLDGVKTA